MQIIKSFHVLPKTIFTNIKPNYTPNTGMAIILQDTPQLSIHQYRLFSHFIINLNLSLWRQMCLLIYFTHFSLVFEISFFLMYLLRIVFGFFYFYFFSATNTHLIFYIICGETIRTTSRRILSKVDIIEILRKIGWKWITIFCNKN